MHNHPEAIQLVEEVAREFLGEDCLAAPSPSMGAEDFGFYLQQAKGAMFRLGCRIEDDPRQLHDSKFDLDETCLPIGSALLAESALRLLHPAS
jgi:amidohydrolase